MIKFMIKKINSISKAQAIDTGMAFTLLSLLLGTIFFDIKTLNLIAVIILIITMSIPNILKPLSVLWFGLSHLLGSIVSKIVLGIIFYGVVTPFGRFIFLFKKDPTNRHEFKKSRKTVFIDRNITFSSKDLKNAF